MRSTGSDQAGRDHEAGQKTRCRCHDGDRRRDHGGRGHSIVKGSSLLTLGPLGSRSWVGSRVQNRSNCLCKQTRDVSRGSGLFRDWQRSQYPLVKEYTLNYRGLNIMILGLFLIKGYWDPWVLLKTAKACRHLVK